MAKDKPPPKTKHKPMNLKRFKMTTPGGNRVIKSGFNPGRNVTWDWNGLLAELEALEARVEALEERS